MIRRRVDLVKVHPLGVAEGHKDRLRRKGDVGQFRSEIGFEARSFPLSFFIIIIIITSVPMTPVIVFAFAFFFSFFFFLLLFAFAFAFIFVIIIILVAVLPIGTTVDTVAGVVSLFIAFRATLVVIIIVIVIIIIIVVVIILVARMDPVGSGRVRTISTRVDGGSWRRGRPSRFRPLSSDTVAAGTHGR